MASTGHSLLFFRVVVEDVMCLSHKNDEQQQAELVVGSSLKTYLVIFLLFQLVALFLAAQQANLFPKPGKCADFPIPCNKAISVKQPWVNSVVYKKRIEAAPMNLLDSMLYLPCLCFSQYLKLTFYRNWRDRKRQTTLDPGFLK